MDASLAVCTLPVVEQISLHTNPRACATLRATWCTVLLVLSKCARAGRYTRSGENNHCCTKQKNRTNSHRHENTHLRTKPHTHPPTHPPTHRLSHPPIKQPTHHVLSSTAVRTSHKRMRWFAEAGRYCGEKHNTVRKKSGPLPKGTETLTHVRNDPPTRPTTHRPAQPPCATAIQQYGQ